MYSFHTVVHRHRVKGRNSQVTKESTINRSSIFFTLLLPKHTSKCTKDWLKTKTRIIMQWPTPSLDCFASAMLWVG